MIQAMYNGVSGLKAHKTEMDVISNNIANINTVGFKGSRVSFKQMLSQTIRGAGAPNAGGVGGTNPQQIGLGVGIGSIDVNQTQGSLTPTGKTSDIAIEGNGYLVLSDGSGKYYTRDGCLQLDGDGNLVSAGSGLKILGWAANQYTGAIDDSAPISASSSIKLPMGQLTVSRQTSQINVGGILNSETPTDGKANVTLSVFDSLGADHDVTVDFVKTANPGEWSWSATSPDGTVAGSGTMNFDANGVCTTNTGGISLTLNNPNGANNPIDVTVNFQAIAQKSSESCVKPASQDGVGVGVLNGFTVDKDGTINGTFDNGMTQRLGRIAMAQFSNPAGLSLTGNNLVAETGNSGLPQIGKAGTGSMGNLTCGFLESSNVDLPTEFANMIVAQRGFQANSRIITTSDEILQELVQLKR